MPFLAKRHHQVVDLAKIGVIGLHFHLDVAAEVAAGTASCADSLGGVNSNGSGAAAAVSCGANAVEAAARSVSAGMDFAIDDLEDSFANQSAELERDGDYSVCILCTVT